MMFWERTFLILCGFVGACLADDPLYPTAQPIVAGTLVRPGDWPWAVAIHQRNVPGAHCGGTLIDKKTVLTAAHCFAQTQEPSMYTVIVGEVSLRTVDRDNIHRVSKIIVHRGYRFSMATSSPDDIAIIKLSREVPFSKLVTSIELASKSPQMSSMCDVSGWGRTEYSEYDLDMRHTSLKVRDISFCQKFYPYTTFYYPDKQMCAGGFSNSNVCVGDSGGPIACRQGDKYKLHGVVSFGYSACGYQSQMKFPAVFTKVARYVDWIKSNMD